MHRLTSTLKIYLVTLCETLHQNSGEFGCVTTEILAATSFLLLMIHLSTSYLMVANAYVDYT
jgi:hypothetical protein